MKILVVIGTHGSGKSTLIEKLSNHYQSLDKTVYIGEEVARKCPYPLGTIRAQRCIWYAHWDMEMEARKSGCDIVIFDRSVLDNLCYLRDILNQTPSGYGEDAFKFFYPIAKLHMKEYDFVARMPLNLEYLKADDPIRPKSVEYARRIDKLFDEMVDPYVNSTIDEVFDLC